MKSWHPLEYSYMEQELLIIPNNMIPPLLV